MRRALLRIGLLAAAFTVATATFGWWAVAVLGVAWGLIDGRTTRTTRTALTAALAAGLGWAALLGWTALKGPAAELAHRIGGAMGMPGWVFATATVLFAVLVAGSGAAAGKRIRVLGSRT